MRGLPRDLGKVGCPAGGQFQEQTSDVGGEVWKGHSLLLGIAGRAVSPSLLPVAYKAEIGPGLEV